MKTNQPDARVLVHTPSELMADVVTWYDSNRKHPGVPFGLPSVDKCVIPLRPGNLATIIGRPGDGKSSLLAYMARKEAERIQQRNATEREAVVYVTWEQTAEELTAFLLSDRDMTISDLAWGRTPPERLAKRTVKGAALPIWIIGHGIGRAGQKVPRMTPDVVLKAIESMKEDFGVTPTLACFDYLQLIPVPHASERVAQVTEAPILIKELAMRAGMPAIAAVQASRDVDNRVVQLAEYKDAQWASAIEQTSDKVFSIWRPARSAEMGSFIKTESGKSYQVTETLFFLRMLKQRMDRARFTWALHFDPACLTLAELETRGLDDL